MRYTEREFCYNLDGQKVTVEADVSNDKDWIDIKKVIYKGVDITELLECCYEPIDYGKEVTKNNLISKICTIESELLTEINS